MSARNVIAITEDAQGQLESSVLKAVPLVPEGRKRQSIRFAMNPLPQLSDSQQVLTYGAQIRDALKQHPAVSRLLDYLGNLSPRDPRTLCFEIRAGAGEAIRWEILRDAANGFVATDGGCGVGRIAESLSANDTGYRQCTLPIQLVAFIGAAGVDGTAQCELLLNSISKARTAGLAIQANIFVGQQSLMTAYGAGRPGITVQALPGTAAGVERELARLKPQVVHFFCHGYSRLGNQQLQLATINDELIGQPGSVVLSVYDLLQLSRGLKDAWLVVLNCCEGGQAPADDANDPGSIAFQVVSQGGVPAAMGMLEPISPEDADVVCEALYPALFDLALETIKAGAGSAVTEMDITAVLVPTRRALFAHHRNDNMKSDRWTLPILYLHPERLMIHVQNGEALVLKPASPTPFDAAAARREGRIIQGDGGDAAPAPSRGQDGGTRAPAPSATAPRGPAAPPLTDEELDAMRTRLVIVANFLKTLPPTAPPQVRLDALEILNAPPAIPRDLWPDEQGQFSAAA